MANDLCSNPDCRYAEEWLVDPGTQLCAGCLYDSRVDVLLRETWSHAEDSPEYAAAEAQLDAMESGGIKAVDNEILARR